MALLAFARQYGMRAMGRSWLRNMVHPARLDDEPLVNGILDMIAGQSVDLYAAQIHALLARPDASALLGEIRCPTLVLVGREDSWAPVSRHEEMAALIPRASLTVVPDCGHMCTLEQPEAVSRAMRGWLTSVGGGGG
jgi:pimeloyl-ACP methyl ester carboxylesterase